jgi:hypothetical protein
MKQTLSYACTGMADALQMARDGTAPDTHAALLRAISALPYACETATTARLRHSQTLKRHMRSIHRAGGSSERTSCAPAEIRTVPLSVRGMEAAVM